MTKKLLVAVLISSLLSCSLNKPSALPRPLGPDPYRAPLDQLFSDSRQLELARSISRGSCKKVLDAASSGFDIGFEGRNNATLLFVALRSNEVRAYQCLLDAGASPTQMTDGIPLLSRAVLLEDLRFARTLIEYGADPNAVSETTGRRPIHSATLGGIPQIQVLLDAGADLNASTEIHKATAVMLAAASGRFEMVEFLLDEGASVCQRDFRDRTLLDYLRDSTSLESRELRTELIGRVQERLAEC